MFNFYLAFEFLQTLSTVRVRRLVATRVPARDTPDAPVLPDNPTHDSSSTAVEPPSPPRQPTPPPGPSGIKRSAVEDELTPIKKPKRRRIKQRPRRLAAQEAEKLIKTCLEEIRLGKRLWIRRHKSPAKVLADVDDADDTDADNSDDDGGGVYEVQAIVDEKVMPAGDKLYLVQWVGFDQPTWEPPENLVACRQSMDAFEATYDPGFDERSVADSDSEEERQ